MSWSVSASGSPAEVRGQLLEKFKGPLALPPVGLSDAGERQTVEHVANLIEQILSTYGDERQLQVSANGHMGFSEWEAKTNPYQNVNLALTVKG